MLPKPCRADDSSVEIISIVDRETAPAGRPQNLCAYTTDHLLVVLFSTWRAAASAMGLQSPEGTAQETNVVQTFITASISVAYTGGFGMYLAGKHVCAHDHFSPTP